MTRQQAKEKAKQLVAKMTVEEKVSQLVYEAKEIERLNIKDYNWWNEALHGVARAGTATVFPQAISMAASFDKKLLGKIAAAISDEGRAKYNQSVALGDRSINKGLTYWSPNVNIFRDPKWGRGHETYGEDPFLSATLGVEYVKNLQGDGEFLKASACAKHFAVHSGPEGIRHSFDAKASKKDMWETYLPAFEYLVKKAHVESVMGAYNRTNGHPCCAQPYLMGEVLRGKWQFDGHFVSDCGAIHDFHAGHKVTEDAPHSAALALKNGCDLNCGVVFNSLIDAYEQDLVDEEDIDKAAVRLFTTRFMLGEFEENRPYADIPFERVDCEEYRALNLKMAGETSVLLKNDGILPLKDNVKSVAVIGPNADSRHALPGNYAGTASHYTTVLEGIQKVFKNARVTYAEGCPLGDPLNPENDAPEPMICEAVAVAKHADVTIACVGLDEFHEGEEGYCPGFDGDKISLGLYKTQQQLLSRLCDATDNLIVVILSGSSLDLGEEVNQKARGVIQAFYPGAEGGYALAQMLKGEVNPSGRLPVTFYRADAKLPDFEDYSMKNRTYRYYEEKPLYSFGYGLSYTKFGYSNMTAQKTETGATVKVTVKNNGDFDGREVVEVYASLKDSKISTPFFQLCAFDSVFLKKGEEKTLTLDVEDYWLEAVNDEGERVIPDGEITIYVGGHLPDERCRELGLDECLKTKLLLK